jgi:hypothetical protein
MATLTNNCLEISSSSNVQERAEHLIAVADAVHHSNTQRKEKMNLLLIENAKISNENFDDSSSNVIFDGAFDANIQHIDQESQSSTSNNNQTEEDCSFTIVNSEKRKSRFQTVSELKQQILDCNKALLTLQENADLKYRKLELKLTHLKSTLETSKLDLENANKKVQELEKENNVLQQNLQQAIGKDQVEFLASFTHKETQMELETQKIMRERDQVIAENETIKKMMDACTKCRSSILASQVSKQPAHASKATGLWQSLKQAALKGLDAEAEVTPVTPEIKPRPVVVTRQPPPQQMFLFREQSQRLKLDLEADIDSLEKQMKDDIEALKTEWSKPVSMQNGRNRRKQQNKKQRPKPKGREPPVIGGLSSLDSFFASASQGLDLQSEEMDEERSLFSLSRSVASAPVATTARRRRKKKSNYPTDMEDTSTVASSSASMVDPRQHYRNSSRSTSFRDNFRASLLGLGSEISRLSAKRDTKPETYSLDDLHESSEWTTMPKQSVTVSL